MNENNEYLPEILLVTLLLSVQQLATYFPVLCPIIDLNTESRMHELSYACANDVETVGQI